MDEKELIVRTRNSLKEKKSRSDILRAFQKRGYKLEYAEQILSKASRPKRIFLTSLFALILISCLVITSFSTLILISHKTLLENPLSGLTTNAIITSQNLPSEDIKITPEFISYILNEIGAWKLHRNPITFESPIINFKIGDETFHSEVGSQIKTEEGFDSGADIEFDSSKEEVFAALNSANPKESVKSSLNSGKTTLKLLAGKTELFSKGYNGLYTSLEG